MNITEAYAYKAEKYARYRWDYAPEAIQMIFEVTQVGAESSVADIGAGTGMLTKHFVGKVEQVFLVEPNVEMREVAARTLGDCPSCHIVNGRAEATTLPDRSVDLIAVAQAIHWFEPELARAEFWRILRLGGWLGILWNEGTNAELNEALHGLFSEEYGVAVELAKKRPKRRPMTFYFAGEHFLRYVFPFTIRQTWERFVGALSAAAFMPNKDDLLYPRFERAAREVFDRFCCGDLLEVRGVTELVLGEVHRRR